MFTYYVWRNNSTSVYYCAGSNPSTGTFEFYDSEDNKVWHKNTIQFIETDEDSHNYKVESKDQADLTLRVLRHNTQMVLVYKESNPSPNLFASQQNSYFPLNPIPTQCLPFALRPIDEKSLASHSQKPNESPTERPIQRKENQYSPESSKNINLQILGGFMAVLGGIAVALAFTVLNTATLGGFGIAAIILGVGFFAAGTYRNCRESPDELDLSNESLLTT